MFPDYLSLSYDYVQTNDVIESDAKEVIKKPLDNAPKHKDDEKTQLMQIIGLIRPVFFISIRPMLT